MQGPRNPVGIGRDNIDGGNTRRDDRGRQTGGVDQTTGTVFHQLNHRRAGAQKRAIDARGL